MNSYEMSLNASPQKFAIDLAGVSYSLTFTWNKIAGCWMIKIADSNGNTLIGSIPVVTGANLLSPFGYMDFGGSLIAYTDDDLSAVPTFDNLGSQGHICFVTP